MRFLISGFFHNSVVPGPTNHILTFFCLLLCFRRVLGLKKILKGFSVVSNCFYDSTQFFHEVLNLKNNSAIHLYNLEKKQLFRFFIVKFREDITEIPHNFEANYLFQTTESESKI